MKVILKGGSKQKNREIERFFMDKVYPILKFGIAIEPSDSVITVYEKDGGEVRGYVDPTAEVIVELGTEAINLARDLKVPMTMLEFVSGNFFDEALAIRKIEESHRSFSAEYYSCSYTPASKPE